MSSTGSAAMDFSMGEEGEIRGSILRSTESTLKPRQSSQRQRINDMRRSASGETENYKEIRQIGSGGFGNCFLLERQKDQALRVVKVQARDFQDDDGGENTPFEVHILRDILPQHDRILRLHDFVVHPDTVQLYYDYYGGGDLQQLIRHYSERWEDIPETFLWHVYLQLSEAVAFLHHGYDRHQRCAPPANWMSVIHGDIKDKNIFLGLPDPSSSDPLVRAYPSIVLGDFGMADLEPTHRYGTPQWQPPEVPTTSIQADIWCLGGVMHSLAHEGRPPIAPLPCGFAWDEWCDMANTRDPIPLYGLYSNEMHDCVFSALAFEPDERPDSCTLHTKVSEVWYSALNLDCGDITPLISPLKEKSYNENGATLNTSEERTTIKQTQETATFSPVTDVKKIKEMIDLSSDAIVKKRHYSELVSPSESAVASKKPKLDDSIFRDSLIRSINSRAEQNVQDDCSMDCVVGRNRTIWDELMAARTQTFTTLAPPSPSGLAVAEIGPESGNYCSDNDVETALEDSEIQAVAKVICNEDLTWDQGEAINNNPGDLNDKTAAIPRATETVQLHAAVASTLSGMDFVLEPSDCFIKARNHIYIFGGA